MRKVAALAAAVMVAAACGIYASGSREDAGRSVQPRPATSAAPARPGTYSFAVIGDWGSGLDAQYRVANRMCRWRENHAFDTVVTTGDNIYEHGEPERFEEAFFRPMSCLLDDGVRFRASLGNHDLGTDDGRPQLDEPSFGMKGRNYVVRRGGVRLVILDSNDIDRSRVEELLRDRRGDRWKIVAFHHPVYSSGEHGSTPSLSEWMPELFARAGVDLVLNGHDHNYEVTRPIRKIPYVVTGGGGASLRPCGEPQWFTERCVSRHHFLYVRTTDEHIVVKAVPPTGRPFDVVRTSGRE